jgi:chemotaxis protein methyltransferase CheR
VGVTVMAQDDSQRVEPGRKFGSIPQIRPEEFSRIQRLMLEIAGIRLIDGKQNLVRARLFKRLRALDLNSIAQYLDRVASDPAEQEHLLNALTTNVTAFFRERAHFDLLEAEATTWTKTQPRMLKVWSCGCSMGHEPYSIAITLQRVFEHCSYSGDWKILATDLSTRALAWCRAACYPEAHLRGLDDDHAKRCFRSLRDGRVQLRQDLVQRVRPAWLNIATTPFQMQGPLEAIFCRNVMIYLDTEVRWRALEEFGRLLRPGGLLFIGHSESLSRLPKGFTTVRPSVYRWGGAPRGLHAPVAPARS